MICQPGQFKGNMCIQSHWWETPLWGRYWQEVVLCNYNPPPNTTTTTITTTEKLNVRILCVCKENSKSCLWHQGKVYKGGGCLRKGKHLPVVGRGHSLPWLWISNWYNKAPTLLLVRGHFTCTDHSFLRASITFEPWIGVVLSFKELIYVSKMWASLLFFILLTSSKLPPAFQRALRGFLLSPADLRYLVLNYGDSN